MLSSKIRVFHFGGHNIIFRTTALQKIANEYLKKYQVLIYVHSVPTTIDCLTAHIITALSETRKQYSNAHQIGFIFCDRSDNDDVYGHALPMIWQKEGAQEHLFFLDSGQFLGDIFKEDAIRFRVSLRNIMSQMQLWSIFGRRQIDYSSCYTDALVVLKDGLRAPSFKALVERKLNAALSTSTLKIFYAPEILLKTAQIGSYAEKSHANPNEVIDMSNAVPVTLEAFRQQYHLPVTIDNQKKLFGTFTLFKAQEYVQKLVLVDEQAEFVRMMREFKAGPT